MSARLIGAALTAMLLAGCATDPATTAMMLQAQADMHKRPTLSVECPLGGCSIQYTDPRDRAAVRMPTNGWDAAIAVTQGVKDLALGAAPWVAVGTVAVKGIQSADHSTVTTTTSTTTDRHDTVTTTQTASGAGAAVGGNGQFSDRHDSVATSDRHDVTDDHSINNSNNPVSTTTVP